jgi:hypothetical protein
VVPQYQVLIQVVQELMVRDMMAVLLLDMVPLEAEVAVQVQ